MKIISFNANGLRSATRKGFFDWFKTTNADILCIQETKAQANQLLEDIYIPEGYYRYFSDAEKKGYSGVSIYTRIKPKVIANSLGIDWADKEGRFLEVEFNDLKVISVYFPSGSSGNVRQLLKMEFLEKITPLLSKYIQANKNIVICGDLNIVHKEIDIKNWKSNQKNSGCLPEERLWLDNLFNKIGFYDVFRSINKKDGQYTWWSNRGKARSNNVGWRIDYQIANSNINNKAISTEIYKSEWFSDHAPLIINYDYNII